MTWPQYKRRECSIGEFVIGLSGCETEMLAVLLMRYPEPVRRAEMIEALYEMPDREPDSAEHVVEVIMNRLAHKVGKFRVQSHNGFGYRLRQRPSDMGART